jgi:HAD superfamily hydrolase (TIGR01509 family)
MGAYKAFVFDMDGVIFDSEKAVIECWKKVAPLYGITDIEKHCNAALGLTASETRKIFFERYGDGLPYDEMIGKRRILIRQMFDEGRVATKPGVTELLSYLKNNGYKVALASSTSQTWVRHELELAGLIGFFDELVCGDMVSRSKPEPDIFLEAVRRLGVLPEESVAVEDSYNGVRSAKSAGLFTVMVPDLLEPDDEMRKIADKITDSLNSVLEWIRDNE